MHDETIINTSTAKNSVASLEFEPNDYRHHLDDFDLSEDQQNELLASLWYIMSTLVDIGWNVDTVQILLPDIFTEVAPDSKKLIESKSTPQFDQAEKGKEND